MRQGSLRYHEQPYTGEKAALLLDAEVLADRRAGAPLLLSDASFGRSYPSFDASGASARLDAQGQPTGNNASGGSIGVVRIMGPLEQRATEHLSWDSDGYDAISTRFRAVLDDDRVGSVVLWIDSPGGDAAGCFECVRRMRADKLASGKRVIAYADEMATSAAYALATVADEIYLPATGVVGSIGAIQVHAERSKALAEDGVTVTVVRSGPRKAARSALEPLSDVAKAELEETSAELAHQFAELVAEARGGDADGWLKLEGAVVRGSAAVTKGLANGVRSFEQTLSMADEAARRRSQMSVKAINAALGLPEDAPVSMTEEAAKQAGAAASTLKNVTGETGMAAAFGVVQGWKASATTAGELCKLTGKSTSSEALGVVEGWKASADALPKLQAELKAVHDAKAASDVDSVISAGKAAGKITNDAFEAQLRVIGAESPARLTALVETLPVAMAATKETATKEPQNDAVALTDEEIKVGKQMGITPAQLLDAKRADGAKEGR